MESTSHRRHPVNPNEQSIEGRQKDCVELADMIADAAGDATRLRELLSTLAHSGTINDAIAGPAIPQPDKQPSTLQELAHKLERDRAQRLGLHDLSAGQARSIFEPPPDPDGNLSVEMLDNQAAESSIAQAIPDDHALLMLPDRRDPWQTSSRATITLAFDPAFLNYDSHSSTGLTEHAPLPRSHIKQSIWSFAQLVAASLIGVFLYVGIAGWVQRGRQTIYINAPAVPLTQLSQATATPAPETVGQQLASLRAQPLPELQPNLPFRLPKNFGVFAADGDHLVELSQLPIKIPATRVPLSAEITHPGVATISGHALSFLIFRRDLANSAPQSASLRVVAQVLREMKFIDGKAKVVPIEGTWRVRDISYDLKVSPLEGNPDMILVEPDSELVLPPGRYALVLYGYGYDFTVAGTVITSEQCLEQTQVLNGTVVTECPKS